MGLVPPFEPDRFKGAAAHYLQGRPPYAPALIRRVAEITGLQPRHRVLDIGCGPGQLAMGFAYFARSVLAVDPQPEMLSLGRQRAEGIAPNIIFMPGASADIGESIGARFGPFRLTTIGRAFHWMDRADTLRRLDAVSEADASVALFSDIHPAVPDNAWLAEVKAIRRRYGSEDRAFWRQPDWRPHEAVLLDSPFPYLQRVSLVERRHTQAARIVDRVLSMSSSSRARLGESADLLAEEVGALVATIAVDGLITEVVESVALIASR